MGEYADMILDGTMCQGCGEWLNDGDDGDGFPGWCYSCQPDDEPVKKASRQKYARKKHETGKLPCPACERRFNSAEALRMHHSDKHAATNPERAGNEKTNAA